MQIDFLDNIITTVVATGATWFFARKKYKSDVTQSELQNVREAISIWKETALDLKARLEEATAELTVVKTQLSQFINGNQAQKNTDHLTRNGYNSASPSQNGKGSVSSAI